MTLLQIKYLTSVGKTGNVSKAANDLFVSRPTVSRALRELEDEFGVPLFSRTNSGLLFTEEGKFFYEKCLEIQHLVDTTQRQMRIMREKMTPTLSRTIRIGITPTTSILLYPELYFELKKKYPDINIVTMEYSRIKSRTALEEGEIDFHLTADARLETMPECFDRIELMDTQLVFCMAPAHRLAGKAFVTSDDIKDEPLIYLAKYFQDETSIDKLYTQKGFEPNIKFRSLQMSSIKELTASGLGCAILMQGVIDDGERIVSAAFDPPFPTTVCLVWNRTGQHNEAFYSFLEFAQEFKKTLASRKQKHAQTF